MTTLEQAPDMVAAMAMPEDEVPASTREREARFQATLRTVNIISEYAGKELAMHSVGEPDTIPHAEGVYVFSEHLGNGERIVDTNFHLQPVLLSGAADSAHSVIAGGLKVDFKDGEERTVDVAAKCYAKRTPQERYERALREVIIMEDLASKGELTFEPIALAIAPEASPTSGEVILLTRYNPNMLSMDNLPWGRGVNDLDNIDNAVLAAQALGHFNANLGYMHGDAKIKNVAVEDGSGYGMIDFETSKAVDVSDPYMAGLVAHTDFGVFIDSLEKRGFLKRDGLRETRQVINALGEAYASMWSDAPVEVQDQIMHTVTEVTAKFDPRHIADVA